MSQQSQSGFSTSFQGGFVGSQDGPQIYSASYSGVDVYEMEVNGIAVMRRRKDSWLNATQILKVAGVEKGKRTKILEKEIQTGVHEKVQGGYGKYQGTWIQFDRGVVVCRHYGVEEMLRPLLTYDMGQDGGVAGQGDFNTPTKEQAMAAQRKRLYNSGADARPNGSSGTFFKNISSTASHAVAAISKARFDSPGPRSRSGPPRAPSFSRQPSMHNADDFPGNSQQSLASNYSQQVDSAYSTQQQPGASMSIPDNEPPRKRQRVTMTPVDSFGGYSQNVDAYANAFPGSPTEPNESFIYTQQSAMNDRDLVDDAMGPLPPLPYQITPELETKRAVMMALFMGPPESDPAKLEEMRKLSPLDLDMPIDSQSHTALHWAATLTRMDLLRALVAAGASPYRVNIAGETPLMRACQVTNSMEQGSFPDLLEVLGGTIEARDNKGRTVLHHIAVTSAVKGRNAASRYYLESLLEWVVRQGSVPNSQDTQMNSSAPPGSQTQLPKMGIVRFMAEVVNIQDSSGDTALNIAARISNRSIISQLLEVGADVNIANRVGLRPRDFGIGKDVVEPNLSQALDIESGAAGCTQKSRESSDEITASIAHLLNETGSTFQQEIKSKQDSLDALHASLRTTSSELVERRRDLEQLTAKLKKQQDARQRVANLNNAYEEEQQNLSKDQSHAAQPNPSSSWETELSAMLESAESSGACEGLLPSSAILKARIHAVENRRDMTRKLVQALKGRSQDIEVKYRRIVSLCTQVPEVEVDAVIDGLLKAVESEPQELEITRVRRFLGGVEAVAH
ncbi:hypothetical protein S7711_02648 [Stachybotrys chartarum IBT 7711]|uniref:Transcription factor SWI6 n=1 Tax=Stachybotrys chartarum (strain CBS 109288 / IBT 7711) TaxID=1280523 RepID=A0A084B929_STACB|nr:hypothetical protein S7711_02648 [Stachybotrys chartarum IBT 7711]KFA48748.1 hypothetical protein S40293_01480 [Stachybotrys chartarum IBT 40293]